jgi:DNA-directed RNA polymerase subunit RPC12/RpoP
MKYYCHKCANELSLIPSPPSGKIVRTPYQYEKHLKHTSFDATYSIQSIFSDSSTSAYANYIVDSIDTGAVEIDEQGRKNIIWCAGRETGFHFKSGKLVRPSDAVKVVLYLDKDKLHAFPENSTSFNTATCNNCGKRIVY